MKKRLLFFAVALMTVVGCNGVEEKPVDNGGEMITLTASIDASSRLEINTTDDETFNHFWQSGDQIRVFDGAGHAADFGLDGYNTLSPSNIANFTGSFGYTPAGAVYPAANADAAFDGTAFTVTFPATQTYVANTYDPAANVYVATCSGATLTFQPISCYLRVALYSTTASTAVDHIVITSVGEEKIAGLASVTTEGAVTMDGSAGTSITLNCASPVILSSDSAHPTCFYIAIPAVAVANGLKVDVYKSDGTHLWRNVSVSPLAKKNKVLKMGTLEYSPVASDQLARPMSGSSINTALKTLAAGSPTTYKEDNTTITKIIIETNKNLTGITASANTVALDSSSTYPIFATLKDNVVRIQTNAPTIALRRSNYLFQGFESVTAIEGLANMTNNSASYSANMFRRCASLETLDLSGTKFSGYIRDAAHMFDSCMALTSLILPSTSWSVSNASYMFRNCRKLTEITNLNKISSGASLTDVSYMFYQCHKLSSITFGSGFTCNAVTSFSYMFRSCIALTSLSLQYFDTKAATGMDYMFYNMPKLNTLTLGEDFNSPTLAPSGFFFGKDLTSSQQTAATSSDGFLNIRCTEETGQWLIKTNLRLAHPTNSTYTTKIDTRFYIWNKSTSAYEYKTVYSKLGGKDDYASSATYIYWPSTASNPSDLDWTGDSGEAEAQASTLSPVASYGSAKTGGVSF